MPGRSITDIQADYTAVHDAWLKALKSEQYSNGAKGNRRPRSAELYDQMMKLDAELKRASGVGGITVVQAIPARNR